MKKLTALLTVSYLAIPVIAQAAEDSHYTSDHHGAEHASQGGLPQFDPTWFASQVFWLAVAFAILYLIFAKKTLPEISSVIENRKNHIESDLETAENLTAQADKVQEAYQDNLNKAQANAAEAIKEVENKAKLEAENALEAFRLKSDAELKATEKRIETSKAAAMGEMNQIAVNAAAQAVEKILGEPPKESQVQTVIENMNGKAKAA